ncbi:AMP-binding protein [Actinophytocola oryzae]|uniref:Fatty-acyl-CoA synthase n=1 Tax=Actinophytocola oryzae TaxID=502181 RepID=A0A4R7W2W6_9PSEU|nr:AMP-binding protein [Actinophytocola oryzae]TDV56229.1 fatty-acyl-CoA synthase [Actinophytocola oryzae]
MYTSSQISQDTSADLVELSVGALLAEAAERDPDHLALVAGADTGERREWTYAQLHADARRLALALLARFRVGEHVAIWMPNRAEWVLFELAAGLAGLVMVTVNPAFRAAEVRHVLGQSRAVGLFLVPEYRGADQVATLAEIRADLPHLREVVLADDLDRFTAYAPERELPTVPADAPAQIQYTSGTTGFPKGAVLRHRGVVNNARLMGERLAMSAEDRSLNFMPMFHTGGCVCGTLIPIAFGAVHVILPGFEAATVLAVIESERITQMGCVTTMFTMLLEHPERAERDTSSLRAGWTGGAPVPAALVRRVEREFGMRLTIVFGQTESGPTITQTRLDDSPTDKAETVGSVLPRTEVKIVDPDTGETLPVGQAGELCCRGYLVMAGYFELPEQTAAAIDADGWLHTGDLCSMDERGYVSVTGRLKDMIIRGGENIYPREIENALIGHPRVLDAAVVGVPDPVFGEQPAAFVRVAVGDEGLTDEELTGFLRERLARHKVPRVWRFVTELPLTPSGKIRKYVLRDRLATELSDASTPTAGR